MNSADRESFLNDVRAGLIAGVPIDLGCNSVGATENLLTLPQLDQIQQQLIQSEPVDSLNASAGAAHNGFDSGSVLPRRLAVAAKVFQATRDMPLVLRGLSVGTHSARKAVRSLRWTISYLVIVLFVAWLGMIFFAIHIVPLIQSMRADMLLSSHPELAESTGSLQWINYLAYGFGILLFVTLIAFCLGGVRWFVMLIGGRTFVRTRVDAMANEISACLVESNFDPGQSAKLGRELAGANPKPSEEVESSGRTSPGSAIYRFVPPLNLLSGEHRLDQIKASIPFVLIFFVGGCIALVYGAAVFAPIIELLRDLAISGV